MTWTASSSWGAFIADAGPYVGPWPPAPPIPANVPADAEGIEYIVTTGTLADIDGFSWPDGVEVYRYRPAGSWSTQSGIGQPSVSGAHLFVVFYMLGYAWPSADPAESVLDVVPPRYVTGAVGTDVPDPASGHWSDWFDFPDAAKLTSPLTINTSAVERTGDGSLFSSPSTSADPVPLQDDYIASAQATATGYVSTGTPRNAFWGMKVGRSSFDTPITTVSGSATEAESEVDVIVDGGRFMALPDAPDLNTEATLGLIEGVDFAANPAETGPLYAIDYTGDATSAFDSWNTDLVLAMTGDSGDDTGAGAGYPIQTETTFGFDIVQIDGVVDYPHAAWVPIADGAIVATETVGLGESAVPHTVTVPLSTSPETFMVSIQWRRNAVPIFADWTYLGGSVSSDMWWRLNLTAGAAHPTANLTYPQYRYWIPGGGHWRTVGGHFNTVGGAEMRIKNEDGTWGPVSLTT